MTARGALVLPQAEPAAPQAGPQAEPAAQPAEPAKPAEPAEPSEPAETADPPNKKVSTTSVVFLPGGKDLHLGTPFGFGCCVNTKCLSI